MVLVTDGGQGGITTGNAVKLPGPHDLAGMQVPVPAADTGQTLRFLELPVFAAQGFFDSLPVGDVYRDPQRPLRLAFR